MKQTIYTYNVNGIRAAIRKGLKEWFKSVNPDVLMIQETKAQPEDIDTFFFKELGYHVFVHSAEKKGYSGVMTICRQEPDAVIAGIGNERFDAEGRFLRTDFGDITLINSYFPSGTTGTVRQDVKYAYLDAVQAYINELKKHRPNIILSGDFNICHKPIDISKPEKKKNVSGFLPEERQWVSNFLNNGFVDSFRAYDQRPDQYSWWSYRANARSKNLGWRIDYHMVSESLAGNMKNANIHADVYHSDHCPVSLEMEI
ncbi:MAG: exodeoxyribonuclease III [Bacteroidota bacterium]|nr:exodeoxyribonuclease III [Bacteroidota bacterium]